ncbi:MAG: hypothetical protein RSC68_35295, partial [Acinetobacter sp.]
MINATCQSQRPCTPTHPPKAERRTSKTRACRPTHPKQSAALQKPAHADPPTQGRAPHFKN